MSAAAREIPYFERHQRYVLEIGKRTALVKYRTPETGTPRSKIAHLRDISCTGAQLISRLPMEAGIGSVINVEFTLPGVQRRLMQKACIVRKIDDCHFAVCFVRNNNGSPSPLEEALGEYTAIEIANQEVDKRAPVATWYQQNRQGILVFGVTLVIGLLLLGLMFKRQPEELKILSLSAQGSFQGWDLPNSSELD